MRARSARSSTIVGLAVAALLVSAVPAAATDLAPRAATSSNSVVMTGMVGLESTLVQVTSVSCASPGNCVAGGNYFDNARTSSSPFVANEVNGVWQTAIPVPGIVTSNAGGSGSVNSVSCGSAGNCVAGGSYSEGHDEAFVADEVGGVWGPAIEVPGIAVLDTGDAGAVMAVSCASAGNCVAGGTYSDATGRGQAFVADEANGVWGSAIEVPGTAALNVGYAAIVESVSCASAGNCVAAGYYIDGTGNQQAFVADKVNGVWETAVQVPGTAALETFGARVSSVSCASAGNCVAGGNYTVVGHYLQAFVADDVNGVWQTAIEVPGTAAINTGGDAPIYSVSCGSAGNCVAGGAYTDSAGKFHAFVASEVNRVWQSALEVPGTAALATENIGAQVLSVSCASAGNCAASGPYFATATPGYAQEFVSDEVNGVWQNAIEMPGLAAVDSNGAENMFLSCPSAGSCTAAGFYNYAGGSVAFVANQVKGAWQNATEVPGTGPRPTVTIATSPPDGSNGWFVLDPLTGQVSATAVEGDIAAIRCGGASLSTVTGLATTTATGQFTVGTQGKNTVSCTATDSYGNPALTVVATVELDSRPPSITAAIVPRSPSATGWYNSSTGAPTVRFACADPTPGSGIATCPAPLKVGQGPNQAISGTATDIAGNVSNPAQITGVNIDTVPPTLTCESPAPAFHLLQTGAKVSAAVSDGGSGPAKLVVSATATTKSVGKFLVNLRASDKAGNHATITCPYTVV